MHRIESMIKKKAYELGYEKCGIIPVSLMQGYAEKFNERIHKVPESEQFYKSQQRLVNPLAEYPWAKSVIVLAIPYNKYKVPQPVRGHIAKTYLFDVRADENTKEYQNSLAIEQYMKELGLQVSTNRKFGVIGMRWAALQAGIGNIRRNNFLYTESGSWVHLEAWLTDQEMNLKEESNLPQCPEGCMSCIKACPTHSLLAPYTMSPTSCISFLTTFGGRNLPQASLYEKFGACIYGCDICQDACPMNKGKWHETEEFPGLNELVRDLTPEKIINMEQDFYKEKVQPKFFYLSFEELWKWKVNVLCFMRNNYKEAYRPLIKKAYTNENEKVREMAHKICLELSIDV